MWNQKKKRFTSFKIATNKRNTYEVNKACTESVCCQIWNAYEGIKVDLNKLILCSWIGRLNILKISILQIDIKGDYNSYQ